MPKEKQSKTITTDKDYQNLLRELKDIMSKGLYKAYKSVDNIKVQTYWQIGERIVREELKYKDRADYGKYLVEKLVVDLSIDRRQLYRIIKFYKEYQIVATVSPQLSWYHYVELININNSEGRAFYQNMAIANSWSVRELRKQIKNQLYENTSQDGIEQTFQTKLPAVNTEKVFKNSFDFTFTKLENKSERELENKMLANIVKTLKEFGPDFCFLGQQVPIKIDQETHYIDLVLYHRGIPCAVLVDLKSGKIDSGDIGQMNKYINYFRQNRQYEHEKDTIGLIIGQEAGREEVKYALGGLEDRIFVAEYKVKLPSEVEIEQAIKKL